MSGEIAAWRVRQPERVRYARMSALRQALEAAVRWGHMARNPAKLAGSNRQPSQRAVRVFTAAEMDAITQELPPTLAPLPAFACATGLRPQEWSALERRDVDRGAGFLSVRRTVSDGEVVDLGKTARSRRQVPLSPRALAALDQLPPRLASPLIFPASGGGIVNTNNFRNRVWAPAIEAASIPLPARVYDMRSTFCSNALAAGVSVFEVAQVMGTSIAMVERVYGALLDGAGRGIADRLAAFEIAQDQAHIHQPQEQS